MFLTITEPEWARQISQPSHLPPPAPLPKKKHSKVTTCMHLRQNQHTTLYDSIWLYREYFWGSAPAICERPRQIISRHSIDTLCEGVQPGGTTFVKKKKDNISRRLTVTFWESAQPRENNAGRHQKRKRKKKTIYLDCHILGERTAAEKHQKKENEKKTCT